MNYAQANIYKCTVYTQHPAEGCTLVPMLGGEATPVSL